jgi:hypothetical protein
MKHWSASRSYECCSCGKAAIHLTCRAAKNCPVSNESADLPDTCCEEVSRHSILPYDAFPCVHNPTASSDAHRKTPASAEHREADDKWRANIPDDLYGSRLDPVEDVSPEDRTRRKILSGHWMRACLHICGLLFFDLKSRIVALFLGFCTSEPDLFFMQNSAKSFNADRADNLFSHQIFTQFFQRPAFEWAAQKVRRALGRLCDESLVILGKFRWSTGTRLRFQCLKAAFIEFLNNSANVMFGIMNKFCDGRHFIALFRGQDHLCPADFDAACTATQYSLNSLTLIHPESTYVETHSSPPRNNLVVSLHIIGIQMGKMLKLKLTFLKRHQISNYHIIVRFPGLHNNSTIRVYNHGITCSDLIIINSDAIAKN